MRRQWLLLGIGAVVLAGAGWAGNKVLYHARVGTAYAAKQTCSCLFVARRAMPSCGTDYDPGDARHLSWTKGPSGVTVTALGGLVAREAIFEPGFGCHLVD